MLRLLFGNPPPLSTCGQDGCKPTAHVVLAFSLLNQTKDHKFIHKCLTETGAQEIKACSRHRYRRCRENCNQHSPTTPANSRPCKAPSGNQPPSAHYRSLKYSRIAKGNNNYGLFSNEYPVSSGREASKYLPLWSESVKKK